MATKRTAEQAGLSTVVSATWFDGLKRQKLDLKMETAKQIGEYETAIAKFNATLDDLKRAREDMKTVADKIEYLRGCLQKNDDERRANEGEKHQRIMKFASLLADPDPLTDSETELKLSQRAEHLKKSLSLLETTHQYFVRRRDTLRSCLSNLPGEESFTRYSLTDILLEPVDESVKANCQKLKTLRETYQQLMETRFSHCLR